MKLLLDTHAFLWFVAGDASIPASARTQGQCLATDSMDRYDWIKATRGRFAKRFPRSAQAVVIDPAVWPSFGSAEAVNEALRAVIEMAKAVRPSRAKRTRAA